MLACLRTSLRRAPHVAIRCLSTANSPPPPPPSPPSPEPKSVLSALSSVIGSLPPPDNGRNRNWRIFHSGDIVSPNDLNIDRCVQERKYKRPRAPPPAPVARYNDVFHQLDLDPVDFALNPSILSAFTSEMGKIYGRNVTGLTARSQRRLGKAIRRARMVGVLPQLSRPPKLWVPSLYRRR